MRQLVSHVSTDYAAFAVTAILVLLFTLVYLYLIDKRRSRLSCPGVEPSHPDEGNLSDINKAGSFHQFLVGLHKRFGPVASFWWGKQLVISLGSPKVFKEVSRLFNRPPLIFKMFEPLIGKHSIQYANEGRGRKMRHVLDRSFSHSAVKEYTSVFNEVGNEVIRKLRKCSPEEHIPVREYMLAVAVKAIMLTSFGDYFKSDKEIIAFEKAYNVCWFDMESRLSNGPPPEGSEQEKNFQKALKEMKDITKAIVAKRLDKKDTKSNILLDVILEDKDLFPTDQMVFDNVITYIVGGFHTTGNVLAWAVYFLSLHPECQEKLFDEIKSVVKDDKTVTMDHMDELLYTRQVIDETLRASLLAPIAARYADFDMVIDGHVIPAKTPMVLSLGNVLEDPEIWSEPARFDPERFSPENRKGLEPFAFEPFGFAGKRKCPGYRFAYFESTVVLAKLVKNFKFKLVSDKKVSKEYGLVTQLTDLWVTVEKRA